MTRARSRRVITGPVLQCHAPVLDAKGRAKLCTTPGATTRTVEGVSLTYCWRHADEIDVKAKPGPEPTPPAPADDGESRIRARWEAEQAKLPPHKRRTWEQACADEEQDMGRKLRASRKNGGP
ncbi:MAG: hypothetical protein QM820_23955 [Minicystis sp.]